MKEVYQLVPEFLELLALTGYRISKLPTSTLIPNLSKMTLNMNENLFAVNPDNSSS